MTIKSDWDKEFEEYKEELEKKLKTLQEEADRKGNKNFKIDDRRRFELNKKLAERTVAEKYNNIDEIKKEYRPLRAISLSVQIVISVVLLINWLGHEDVILKIWCSFLASVFVAIIFVTSHVITNAQRDKERAFEILVKSYKERKLLKDLAKLNRFEISRDSDGWQQFLKEAEELNKMLKYAKDWQEEEKDR